MNHRAAAVWFRKAAEQGHTEAQYSMGIMHDNGKGVPEDVQEAAAWFRKAALQGYAKAQYNMGFKYYMGEGVPRNIVRAYAWINLSAEQGDRRAGKSLSIIRDSMTPDQAGEAETLIRELNAMIDNN